MIYLSYELLDTILTYLPTRKKWLLRRTCKAFNDVLLQQLFKMLRKLQRACKTLPGNVKFLPHEMEHFYNFLLQAGLYEGLPRVTESHIYEWGDKYQYPHEPHDHLPFTLTQASKMHNPLYASVCGLMMLFLYDMHREEGVMGVCGTWAVYCSYCSFRRSVVRDCPDGFRGCGAMMSLNRNIPRCAYWYTARMFRSVRMWEYQSYLEEAFGVYEAIGDIERRCEHFDAVRRREYQEASIGGVWKPPRWP